MRVAWPLIQSRRNAATLPVPQHQDRLDLKVHHGKFDRRADAVKAGRLLERRREVGDIADDEDSPRPGVEDRGRIDAAVGARDNQCSG